MKSIKIIEICSELGAAQLGSSMGPDAIRMAAHKMNSDFFSAHPAIRLPDRNYLLADKEHDVGCHYAKHLRYILENCQIACNTVTDAILMGGFPLVLSADHSSSAGVIAGVKQAYPDERIGIIWLDAHSDLHSPYTTYSGNMHGMPLGSVLALDDQARVLLDKPPNQLRPNTQRQWNHLKELGGFTSKVLPEDLVLIGVRFFKPEHSRIISELGIKLHTVASIREKGPTASAKLIHESLDSCDRIYITFDVDCLDCETVSMGTGTPEPNGLELNEAVEFMQAVMTSPKICCLEVSEVNPVLDNKGNAMGEAAWQIITSSLSQMR